MFVSFSTLGFGPACFGEGMVTVEALPPILLCRVLLGGRVAGQLRLGSGEEGSRPFARGRHDEPDRLSVELELILYFDVTVLFVVAPRNP
jgi:hypothetical protein